MKKLFEKLSNVWNRSKSAVMYWFRWGKGRVKMSSPRAKSVYEKTMQEAVNIMEMDSRASLCELAQKEFPFVSSMNVSSNLINLWCYPDTMSQITTLLKWFAQRGQRQKQDSTESPRDSARVWYLDKIDINATFQSAKENACKYVKVGEEMKPIMKMVCPDDPEYHNV